MKLQLHQFEEKVKEGFLRKTSKDGLSLYVYTNKCNYEKAWTNQTKIARGLVVDDDGNVICKCASKWFNLNEMPETRLEVLKDHHDYVITEKLDGSLIHVFHHNGEWKACSKGSLSNEYIDYALKYLPDMSDVPINKVFMCEVVLPPELDGMQIVVGHEPGLYFLAAFDKYQDFKELDFDKEAYAWKSNGGKATTLIAGTLEQLISSAKSKDSIEGWVISFRLGNSKERKRVKIKTLWYLKLFAFINQCNEKSIKELMANWGVDSVEWLENIPEELQKETKKIHRDLQNKFYGLKNEIIDKFTEILFEMPLCADSRQIRKAFAIEALKTPYSNILFALYDERGINEQVLELV